ncbi:threonine/homoserine efflux transporter RhtA [Planomicrobium soli]|uniref:Threonine/homoserine efflux transporter RhtA n=1 Tax=Planomicrobium soli TaxID=1176648 RepID=A0A2P8H3S5_9BACL|nr:DMT family transporter [Planomicrobium soli]PSL40874.1 threonine/homoserine efflux transporter RhtA [Planomicrobium soli]
MRYLYYSILLLTSFLWAGNFVIGKVLTEHASPMTLTSLRWLIAVACLVPLVWWKEKTLLPPKKAVLPLVLMGGTGVVLFNILQFIALEKTSATNVGLISTLNMLSIAIFSGVLLKEKLNGLQILAMFFSLFGVLLVLTKGDAALLMSLDVNSGDLYMLGAVAIWGLYSVFSKWAMAHVSAMFATMYSGIFGLIILLPFNLPSFSVVDPDVSFVFAILYTGVVSTVLCFVLWNIGVQKIGATTSGIFLNFNPVFTALLAFILLGEQMTEIQVIGSVIVISGCYFFTVFGIKKTKKKQLSRPSFQQ